MLNSWAGYIVFAYPHSWALQRFPVAKYLSANIFLWAVLVGLHCACKNFRGLCTYSNVWYTLNLPGSQVVLRFLLGASEGCITNGVMIVTSMFYTRTEIGERIGWYVLLAIAYILLINTAGHSSAMGLLQLYLGFWPLGWHMLMPMRNPNAGNF